MKLSASALVTNLSMTSIAIKPRPNLILPIAKSTDSVVTIRTIKTSNREKDSLPTTAISSGVIIAESGLILTTAEVVTKVAAIAVKFNGGQFLEADLVQSIPEAHIALLRLRQIPTYLPVAKIGDVDQLKAGEKIKIIDNSLEKYPIHCEAQVTGKMMRGTYTDGKLVGYIQVETDAPYENRDGILFNNKGELLGILSANLITGGNGKMSIAVTINTATAMLLWQ